MKKPANHSKIHFSTQRLKAIPEPAGYSGFEAEMVRDFDHPAPLADGEQGLRNWLTQFYDDGLSRLDEEQRQRGSQRC